MKCSRCKGIIVLHSFTETNCKVCGAKIITHHIPGYTVCKSCSDKKGLCEQCGKGLEREVFING